MSHAPAIFIAADGARICLSAGWICPRIRNRFQSIPVELPENIHHDKDSHHQSEQAGNHNGIRKPGSSVGLRHARVRTPGSVRTRRSPGRDADMISVVVGIPLAVRSSCHRLGRLPPRTNPVGGWGNSRPWLQRWRSSDCYFGSFRRRTLDGRSISDVLVAGHVDPDEDPCETANDIELTILMPCLNEAETLAVCIRKASASLAELGIAGEVLIADNGSTDGSQAIARSEGARVIRVGRPGYGADCAVGSRRRVRVVPDGRRGRQLCARRHRRILRRTPRRR